MARTANAWTTLSKYSAGQRTSSPGNASRAAAPFRGDFAEALRDTPGQAGSHVMRSGPAARQCGRAALGGLIRGLPLNRRVVPAGAARLVRARDRHGVAHRQHGRSACAHGHTVVRAAVRQRPRRYWTRVPPCTTSPAWAAPPKSPTASARWPPPAKATTSTSLTDNAAGHGRGKPEALSDAQRLAALGFNLRGVESTMAAAEASARVHHQRTATPVGAPCYRVRRSVRSTRHTRAGRFRRAGATNQPRARDRAPRCRWAAVMSHRRAALRLGPYRRQPPRPDLHRARRHQPPPDARSPAPLKRHDHSARHPHRQRRYGGCGGCPSDPAARQPRRRRQW
jgi:hypothetical protein